MKISLQWLNDHIDLSDFPGDGRKIADLLTFAGLEVESIEVQGRDLRMVKVGLIIEKQAHPNAEKLSLCQVTTGQSVVHQIVCGAKNHKAGDKVVLALPGSTLPGGVHIQKTLLRGVESAGMLCSEKELGLSAESSGLLVLPEEAPVGADFAEYWGLNDVIFELKITPNRADCLSHLGIARELSTLLRRPLKSPVRRQMTGQASSPAKPPKVEVEVLDTQACPRYGGRSFAHVKVGSTSPWLRKRLENVGHKSINNVVDVTNYVMLDLGQPLHAFDVSKLSGHKILVRKAFSQEEMESFDGSKLSLEPSDLLICDGKKPVGLAGVVGGKNSGISDSTEQIFLEAAYFDPVSIRMSSRRLKANTDAAYRFSRGVDPQGVARALDLATVLLNEGAGAVALDQDIDLYPLKKEPIPVKVSISRLEQRLGFQIGGSKMQEILASLHGEVQSVSGDPDALIFLAPTFRFDLEQEADILEEIARILGYQELKETLPPLKHTPEPHALEFQKIREVSSRLVGQGFNQAFHSILTDPNREDLEFGPGLSIPVPLINPLSQDQRSLRRHLLGSLLENVSHHFASGVEQGQLFEVGQVFRREGEDYHQQWHLALSKWGHAKGWLPSQQVHDELFYHLKSVLVRLAQQLAFSIQLKSPEEIDKPIPELFHPGKFQWAVLQDEVCGYFGELHPRWHEARKLRTSVVLAELNLSPWMKQVDVRRAVRPYSKFPAVTRDLAFDMPRSFRAGQLVDWILGLRDPLVKEVRIFDVYQGEKIPSDRKSVAIALVLQGENETLHDQQVTEKIQDLTAQLLERFEVQLRT